MMPGRIQSKSSWLLAVLVLLAQMKMTMAMATSGKEREMMVAMMFKLSRIVLVVSARPMMAMLALLADSGAKLVAPRNIVCLD